MRKYILLIIGIIISITYTNAETLSLSYSEGKNASGSPVGMGTGDNMWIDMAIKIPGSTVRTLAGASITGVNGSCTSIADIERLHIWLRNDLEGENLAEYELIPNQLKNIKRGQNKLTFKTPWVIPADFEGDLYIGFGYKYSSSNARGLAVNNTPIPGGFYLLRADSKWYDFSHLGTACIEAIVEGDNLPKANVQLSRVDFPDYYIQTRGEYTPTLVIHNFGTETVTTLDVTATFNENDVIKQSIDAGIESGMMKIVEVPFTPSSSDIEQSTLTVNINPTGVEIDADPNNNTISGNFTTAPFEYYRRVLTEEFTTELCSSCPALTEWINTELKKDMYKDVIMVCHHSGFKTDFLSTDWDSEYLKLYGGGSFAPGITIDRSIYEQNDVVIFPEPYDVLHSWWAKRLNEPALVSIDIALRNSDTATDEIIVEVTGEKCIEKIAENPCITVWLVEDNIAAQNQAGAKSGFTHHHVNRAIQSENYWGEPITFDNNKYSYTCTFKIDESWVKENMYVVATIGENGKKYTDHTVCNTNSVTLTDGLNAISTITSDHKVVDTKYYTISGQRVTAPRNGIFICQKTYSDGTTETTKTIVH